jgi:hypothetical protein
MLILSDGQSVKQSCLIVTECPLLQRLTLLNIVHVEGESK